MTRAREHLRSWLASTHLVTGALFVASAMVGARAGDPVPVQALHAERRAFATALRDFRGGDEAALSALDASADRMVGLGRADARGIVDFYRGIAPAARRAGLSAEEQYEALRVEVSGAAERDRAAWPAQRERLQTELEALAAAQRGAADPTPAARAWALLAVLDEQRARTDPGLGIGERNALLVRAVKNARQALDVFGRASLVTPTLEPTWLLARVDEARGNAVAARDGFADCLELAETVDNEDYRVRALRGLITVAESVGDLAEQRDHLRDLSAIREPKDDWWVARRWAALLLAEDEPQAALDFLSKIRPAGVQESNAWHFLCGSALQRLTRFDEAEAHFAEVRLVTELDSGPSGAQIEAHIWRAQAALERGDAAGALDIALPLDTSVCTPAARARCAYTIGAAHLAQGDAERAASALRSALAEGRAIEDRLARADDSAVFGEIVGLETVALLAQALTQQSRALEAVSTVEEVQSRVLRGRDDLAITPSDVRAWAGEYERGLLTWIIGANTTVCAHVAPDGSAMAVAIPIGRVRMHDAVRHVRESAIAGDEPRARALATEILSAVVPGSLRERIDGTGRLLVLAHGPLERLPFDLWDLAEHGPIAVMPGLASARPGAAPTPGELAHWSVLGDPISSTGDKLLPGARLEIENVARQIGCAPLTGASFDRAALVAALRSGRALHVATHLGHGCGQGARDAGLLMAHGDVLCAREIREIAPKLPLAVLAACETAEGRFVDAQVLGSVANAFLASGTRNLCVTLWPVEDGAARRWSEALHDELARGVRPSEAARSAREALRRDGTPVSEWAAFRFVGRD